MARYIIGWSILPLILFITLGLLVPLNISHGLVRYNLTEETKDIFGIDFDFDEACKTEKCLATITYKGLQTTADGRFAFVNNDGGDPTWMEAVTDAFEFWCRASRTGAPENAGNGLLYKGYSHIVLYSHFNPEIIDKKQFSAVGTCSNHPLEASLPVPNGSTLERTAKSSYKAGHMCKEGLVQWAFTSRTAIGAPNHLVSQGFCCVEDASMRGSTEEKIVEPLKIMESGGCTSSSANPSGFTSLRPATERLRTPSLIERLKGEERVAVPPAPKIDAYTGAYTGAEVDRGLITTDLDSLKTPLVITDTARVPSDIGADTPEEKKSLFRWPSFGADDTSEVVDGEWGVTTGALTSLDSPVERFVDPDRTISPLADERRDLDPSLDSRIAGAADHRLDGIPEYSADAAAEIAAAQERLRVSRADLASAEAARSQVCKGVIQPFRCWTYDRGLVTSYPEIPEAYERTAAAEALVAEREREYELALKLGASERRGDASVVSAEPPLTVNDRIDRAFAASASPEGESTLSERELQLLVGGSRSEFENPDFIDRSVALADERRDSDPELSDTEYATLVEGSRHHVVTGDPEFFGEANPPAPVVVDQSGAPGFRKGDDVIARFGGFELVKKAPPVESLYSSDSDTDYASLGGFDGFAGFAIRREPIVASPVVKDLELDSGVVRGFETPLTRTIPERIVVESVTAAPSFPNGVVPIPRDNPAQSARTLAQYYSTINKPLPSKAARRTLWEESGFTGTYTGTASQNGQLLGSLQSGSRNPIPVAVVTPAAVVTSSLPASVQKTTNLSSFYSAVGSRLPSRTQRRTLFANLTGSTERYRGTVKQNSILREALIQYCNLQGGELVCER